MANTLRFAEQRLAVTLAEVQPGVSTRDVVDGAIIGAEKARRRVAARWFRGALAALGLLIIGTYVEENLWPRPRRDIVTETVALKCMPAIDATEIATPYLRSSGAAIYTSPGARVITLRGARTEVMAAMAQLDVFDSRSCSLPAVAPAPPSRSDGTPGKD